MQTSWWTDPVIQRNRALFMAAVAAQMPRWIENEKDIAKKMAGLATPDWMVGVKKSRTVGFSVAIL